MRNLDALANDISFGAIHTPCRPLRQAITRLLRGLKSPGIHNAFQVAGKVCSGSPTAGREAFAALAKLAAGGSTYCEQPPFGSNHR